MIARDTAELAERERGAARVLNLERVAFWLTVSVAATLPFEFTKQWFPVSWLELSRVLMVAAVGMTVFQAIRTRESRLGRGLLAVSALLVLTAAVSVAVHPGAADLKELASSFAYLSFAWAVAWNVRAPRDLGILAVAVVASAVVVAVVAILEQVFNFYVWRGDQIAIIGRRNSTLGDPNIAGRVQAIGVVTLIGLFAATRGVSRSAVALVIAVAATLGIGEALSQSRTVWVLIAVVLLSMIPAVAWRRRLILPMAGFSIAMITAILVLPFLVSRVETINPDDLIAEYGSQLTPAAAMRLGSPTPADPLISMLPIDGVRRYLIRAGVAMWLDHPLTGVGLGGYDEALRGQYRGYIPPDRVVSPVLLVHTDAVRVLAETGLVGFAGWLVFVAAIVIAGVRLVARPRWRRAVGLAALSAFALIFFASQLAGRFATEPYLWLLVGILVAAHRLTAGTPEPDGA
jgi:O-antigen ligase